MDILFETDFSCWKLWSIYMWPITSTGSSCPSRHFFFLNQHQFIGTEYTICLYKVNLLLLCTTMSKHRDMFAHVLKGAWFDFSEWWFWFKWCAITRGILVSKFSETGYTIWIQEEITYFAVACTLLCTVSLIMVTITSQTFINIFHPSKVYFSAVKFSRGNEKKWAFFWYQNLWNFPASKSEFPCKFPSSMAYFSNAFPYF